MPPSLQAPTCMRLSMMVVRRSVDGASSTATKPKQTSSCLTVNLMKAQQQFRHLQRYHQHSSRAGLVNGTFGCLSSLKVACCRSLLHVKGIPSLHMPGRTAPQSMTPCGQKAADELPQKHMTGRGPHQPGCWARGTPDGDEKRGACQMMCKQPVLLDLLLFQLMHIPAASI